MSLIIFIFGLIVGSFLNCVIYRMEMRERGGITSIIRGRPQRKSFGFLRGKSFCPNCKHVLSWYDLIPVVSFFILKAKCRYCKKKISIQYPLVELATAFLFLLIFNYFNYNLLFTIYHLLIASFLIIIFVYDLKHFIIPDFAVFSLIAITLIYNLWVKLGFTQIAAGLGASLFFLLIYLISRGKWMGFGDVKLSFFMGLFLGWPIILPALFFSFLIGAIIGIILILLKKKGLKSEVPFGPFLILGTYIGLFWGKEIFEWYLKFVIL